MLLQIVGAEKKKGYKRYKLQIVFPNSHYHVAKPSSQLAAASRREHQQHAMVPAADVGQRGSSVGRMNMTRRWRSSGGLQQAEEVEEQRQSARCTLSLSLNILGGAKVEYVRRLGGRPRFPLLHGLLTRSSRSLFNLPIVCIFMCMCIIDVPGHKNTGVIFIKAYVYLSEISCVWA